MWFDLGGTAVVLNDGREFFAAPSNTFSNSWGLVYRAILPKFWRFVCRLVLSVFCWLVLLVFCVFVVAVVLFLLQLNT